MSDACKKCGHSEFATQLRHVKVTVGWKETQVRAVCPVRMCTKCGSLSVITNSEIGNLVPLVPEGHTTLYDVKGGPEPSVYNELEAAKPAPKRKAPKKKAPNKKAPKKKRTKKQLVADARRRYTIHET